jgi:hypothetical protein
MSAIFSPVTEESWVAFWATWWFEENACLNKICAPTKELSIYRKGLQDYQDGRFWLGRAYIFDENITVEMIVSWLKEVNNLRARAVAVSNNELLREDVVIWNDVDGFLWDKDAVFYQAMEKLRHGTAHRSERDGKYCFAVTFDKA